MSGTNISSWPKKRTIFSHRLSHEMNKKKLDLSLSNAWTKERVSSKSRVKIWIKNSNIFSAGKNTFVWMVRLGFSISTKERVGKNWVRRRKVEDWSDMEGWRLWGNWQCLGKNAWSQMTRSSLRWAGCRWERGALERWRCVVGKTKGALEYCPHDGQERQRVS